MINTHQGKWDASALKLAIVAGKFNESIVEKLVSGSSDTFIKCGGLEQNIDLFWAPGAFEIPQIAQTVAGSNRFDLVVCLGVIIRGGTPHFEYISSACTQGVAKVALESSAAVSFGVLTCDTTEQAMERAGVKAGNKGQEATLAAIETATLLRGVS